MTIQKVPLKVIDDNPYNPRSHFPTKAIQELAHSIERIGLQQIPKARQVDGRYQLAFGSLRKRAFDKLAKKKPKDWSEMPLEIVKLSDEDMFVIAVEENLKRSDLKPIEVARGIEAFLSKNPKTTETMLADALGMTQAHVANMRRVLKLPEKLLEKIDEDVINFTMGRELLVLNPCKDAESLMLEVVRNLKFGNKTMGEPCTVEGIQKSIHSVCGYHLKTLTAGGWYSKPDFDIKTCKDCTKIVTTHPEKKTAAAFCIDDKCWNKKQEDPWKKMAEEAKKKMEEDIAKRLAAEQAARKAADEKAAEETETKAKTICVEKAFLEKSVKPSCSCQGISEKGSEVTKPFDYDGKKWICTGNDGKSYQCYQLLGASEWNGETRTYSVPKGRDYDEYYESLRNDPNGFYHGMLVNWGKSQCVLVGPETVFTETISQEIPKEAKGKVAITEVLPPAGVRWAEDVPDTECAKCNLDTEDHCINFSFPAPSKTASDGVVYRKVCVKDYRAVTKTAEGSPLPPAPAASDQKPETKAPAKLLALAKEKAGTRAEVLDLKELQSGDKAIEHVVLKGRYEDMLRQMDEPTECLERCTEGFHYAFDSQMRSYGYFDQKEEEPQCFYVCTNPKCVTQKKSAFTRKKNAEGNANKKAELKAIKDALDLVAQTVNPEKGVVLPSPSISLPRAALKLLVLHELDRSSNSYYSTDKSVKKWFWDKLSAGVKEEKREDKAFWQLIDKLTDAELAKLVVERAFVSMLYTGDAVDYKINTKEPLGWFGVKIEKPEVQKEVPVGDKK